MMHNNQSPYVIIDNIHTVPAKTYFDVPAVSSSLMNKIAWRIANGMKFSEDMLNSLDSGSIATESTMFGDAVHKMLEHSGTEIAYNSAHFHVLSEVPSKALVAVMESKKRFKVEAYLANYSNNTTKADTVDHDEVLAKIAKIESENDDWKVAKEQGMCVITKAQEVLLKNIAQRMNGDTILIELLNRFSKQSSIGRKNLHKELALVGDMPYGNNTVLKVKAMLDRVQVDEYRDMCDDCVSEVLVTVIDWKTSFDTSQFPSESYKTKYEYWRQFAWYAKFAQRYFEHLYKADGIKVTVEFYTVVVSSKTGYHKLYKVSQNDLERGITGGFINPINNFNSTMELSALLTQRQEEALQFMGFALSEHRVYGAQEVLDSIPAYGTKYCRTKSENLTIQTEINPEDV